MCNQNEQDNACVQAHPCTAEIPAQAPNYYAVLSRPALDQQDLLLDRVIDFAFDTLGVRRLHLRVYDEE